MASETRAKWTDLVAGVGFQIAAVFDQGGELYTPGIGNIINVKTAGQVAQTNYTGKTGFGKLNKFAEGDDIPTTNRYKTYTTSVLYNSYGESVTVTKLQLEDRDFENELNEMRDLSRAYQQSIDESSMQLLNGGFSTTTTVNGYDMTWYNDTKPQFSTIHPTVVPGGSTQSNASSTGIKLSHDNLETGRVALTLQQTDNGRPMTLTTNPTLVVPIALEKTATETIGSILVPETANNALNFFKGSVNMLSSAFLDAQSSSAWFLINKQRNQLYYESRQDARVERDVNILNKTVTFTIDARWANYSLEWKGTWGSKGDLATYSS